MQDLTTLMDICQQVKIKATDLSGDDKLEKKDKNFTYAKPDELAVHDHQREWTQKDRIHLNKLKFLYDRWDYQRIQVLIFKNGVER